MTDKQKRLEPADTALGHIVREAMWGAQMDVTDRARLNALVYGIFNGLAQDAGR